MSYSTRTRKENQKTLGGIWVPVDVEYQELDPVPEEVETLAKKLFEITSHFRGSLCVTFEFQPDEVRDYHHKMAEAALSYANTVVGWPV